MKHGTLLRISIALACGVALSVPQLAFAQEEGPVPQEAAAQEEAAPPAAASVPDTPADPVPDVAAVADGAVASPEPSDASAPEAAGADEPAAGEASESPVAAAATGTATTAATDAASASGQALTAQAAPASAPAASASAQQASAAAPAHPAAAAGISNGHVYVITSANATSQALESTGSNVRQASNGRTPAQQWRVAFTTDGYVTLQNVATGKLLDVSGARAANGANVLDWKSNGGLNQKWTVARNDDGTYAILSALSTQALRLALDVKGASKASGANVLIWSYSGAANQRWSLADATAVWAELDAQARQAKGAIGSGGYAFSAGTSRDMVLDVTGASKKAGANLETWTSTGGGNQRWTVTVGSDGYATITSQLSGKVLDVSGARAVAGANVIQWDANGGRNQKWIVSRNADGTYRIASALWTGLSLNVAGGSSKAGANVELRGSNANASQKWSAYSLTPAIPASASVSNGWYALRSALDPSCYLDVTGANAANGTPLELWSANTSVAQVFRFARVGGYYRIETGAGSGSYLDVEGGKVIPGTKAEVWRSSSSASLFSLQYEAALGGYRLVNVASGLALAPTYGKAAQGARVTAEKAVAGSAAQTFVLVARPGLITEGIYTIRTALAGERAVSVKDSSLSSGGAAVINTYLKGVNQKWQISAVAGKANTYTIESISSGMRLAGASNAQVVQRPAAGVNLQMWVPSYSAGAYVFKNLSTGKVLDVSGASGADGAKVLCWTAKSGAPANQRFKLASTAAVDSGVYEFLIAANAAQALDVQGDSLEAGANVEVYARKGSNNQKWYFDAAAGTIRSLSSGLVLDVDGASSASGANVLQWSAKPSGNANQKWAITYDGAGRFKVASALGPSLVLSADTSANLGNVTSSTDGSKNAGLQRWRLVSSNSIEPMGFNLINSIVSNGHGSLNATYIVIHETANPGATARNHRDYWKNDDTYAVHYTVDWTGNCYYCVPEDRLCWQVGNGNKYVVGIELCHATTKSNFDKVWNYGVQWASWQLAKNGWGVDRLLSHYDCTQRWGGSDHTDPIGYFAEYGKTWSQFKSDVAKALAAR